MHEFGHKLRDNFYMYQSLVNFNHGSFGAVPKMVMQAQHNFHEKQESCPELWFREWYSTYINTGREKLAVLINSTLDEVVFVENASYAVNSVVSSFPFKDGDVVICFDCAYMMTMEALRIASIKTSLNVVYVPIEYPIQSVDRIILSLEKELLKHESVAMCIFDHVSSMPSILMPVAELTTLAKSKGAMVLIDGAHAPGMVDIDVTAIGADAYTGNCHKWLFAPKGTAFLYTRRDVQTEGFPLPCVVSSTGKRDFVGRFEYTGTRDYTPFATFPESLSFINSQLGGILGMRAYNRKLLQEGSELVRQRWNTFYLVPESMTGFMSNVALPAELSSTAQLRALEQRLLLEHHVSIKGESVRRTGTVETIFFVRLSAQVYLELSDFANMADLVLQLLPEILTTTTATTIAEN